MIQTRNSEVFFAIASQKVIIVRYKLAILRNKSRTAWYKLAIARHKVVIVRNKVRIARYKLTILITYKSPPPPPPLKIEL